MVSLVCSHCPLSLATAVISVLDFPGLLLLSCFSRVIRHSIVIFAAGKGDIISIRDGSIPEEAGTPG